MTFDSAKALRSATGRAKSDVANKLVSMLLHEISRKVCEAGGSNVSDADYLSAVISAFGHRCLYCRRELEHDRAAVEHLDGMNRFRVGLHVPGNVAVACRRCNSEKRRDDSSHVLSLAESGWESFLSHDGSRCSSACKTCAYWSSLFPDEVNRRQSLRQSLESIQEFRRPFERFTSWSARTRPAIQSKAEVLYRSCQDFATAQINSLASELSFDFNDLAVVNASRSDDGR